MVDLERMIKAHGSRPAQPLSINQMYEFGDAGGGADRGILLAAAQYVHGELPVRCTHLVRNLLALPYGLERNPAIQQLVQMFHQTLRDITAMPQPRTTRDEAALRAAIQQILARHREIVVHLRKALVADVLSEEEKLHLQPFLDRFFAQRIGNRTVLAHYLALQHARPGWVGVVKDECRVEAILQDAFRRAATFVQNQDPGMMTQTPALIVEGHKDCTLRYVEAHMAYVFVEVMHNAMHSTKRAYRKTGKLTPIRAVIADGERDVCVRVSDLGNGFDRKFLPAIWTHLNWKPTAGNTNLEIVRKIRDVPEDELHGPLINGYLQQFPGLPQNGLPTCRLYARHFGGDLQVAVMKNYGCDVYATFPKSGEAKEALPTVGEF